MGFEHVFPELGDQHLRQLRHQATCLYYYTQASDTELTVGYIYSSISIKIGLIITNTGITIHCLLRYCLNIPLFIKQDLIYAMLYHLSGYVDCLLWFQ